MYLFNQKSAAKILETFLDMVQDAEKQYEIAHAEVNQKDSETQDYMHALELQNLSYNQCCKVATKLKKCRQQRRKNKDIVEQLQPLISYINKNKNILNGLKGLLGELRKQDKYLNSRQYFPRVIKDVTKE